MNPYQTIITATFYAPNTDAAKRIHNRISDVGEDAYQDTISWITREMR